MNAILTPSETRQSRCESSDRRTPLTILYFGNDWAAENHTSSHQIARRLAQEHRVFYLECPGLRAPKGTPRDLKKIWAKVTRFLRGPRRSPEGLHVWTLLQLPLHRFRLVRWLNRRLLRTSIRAMMRLYGIRDSIAWFNVPHLSTIVDFHQGRLIVYYVTDDYSAYPGVNADRVRQMDDEMTRKADLVFVVSDTLVHAKRAINPNTHLSPHGVDASHFGLARQPGKIPADIADLKGPIIGYFGLIEEWFDMELLVWLAEQRPNWTFVLIGRIGLSSANVPTMPNILFLGKKPYADLPLYGRRFDAAIIPSNLKHRFAQHASPLKLREYLAMGVPVVATATPENQKFADAIHLAENREQFLACLDEAVSRPITAEDAKKRMERVANQTWEARTEALMDVVSRKLRNRKMPPD